MSEQAPDIYAFPSNGSMGEVVQEGMTLRDYFAAKAMQAAITTAAAPYMTPDKHCATHVAQMAYEMADAMLTVRNAK